MRIAEAEAALVAAELRVQSEDIVEANEAVGLARSELNKLLDWEEVFWKQRARAK